MATANPGRRHFASGQMEKQRLYIFRYTFTQENIMAHKKIERMKEIDRRRKRREERLKLRIKEAKAAAGSK